MNQSTDESIHSVNELEYVIFNKISPEDQAAMSSSKDVRVTLTTKMSEIFNKDFWKMFRYNLLTRLPERLYDKKYKTMSKGDSVYFNVLLINNLKKAGCTCNLTIQDSDAIMDYILMHNCVDPFYDYVSQIKWDGVPRVRRWFIDGLGASIPGLDKETSDRVIEEATQAWFVGTIGRSNGNACKLEIVPVLIGKQGAYKSTYVAYTAMSTVVSDWYNSTTADLKDPKIFFESMKGAKIVEWSESTQLKRAEDVEVLKAFISQEKDTYRQPYCHNAEIYNRQFSCIMTSNESTLFNDTTGNRRFVPMVCSDNRARQIDYENMADNLYDVQQVWAEALALLRNGAKARMPSDVEQIAMCQTKKFTRSNEFFDEVISQLDENYPNVGDYVEIKTLKRMISNIKYDFDEMRNRIVRTEDLIKYSDGCWVLEMRKYMLIDGRPTYRNAIMRIKPPSRIAEE